MIILLLILTAISCLSLVIGFIWFLVAKGETFQKSGEIGGQIMGEQPGDNDSPVFQDTAFKGKAKSVQREASISFTEIKASLVAGHYSEAFPSLLVIIGILGLVLFGSLSLFVVMENKLVGGLIAAVAIFTTLRIGFRMVIA